MHGDPYGKIPRFGRTLNEPLDDADSMMHINIYI